FGKAVKQSEGDELRQFWFIAVRQITAFVPAAKAFHRVLAFGWRGITALVRNQLANAWVMWRTSARRLERLTHAMIERIFKTRCKSGARLSPAAAAGECRSVELSVICVPSTAAED